MLVVVIFLWVGSAELEQAIFKSQEFPKAYFVTYLDAGTFGFYLLGFAFRRRWRAQLAATCGRGLRRGARSTTRDVQSPANDAAGEVTPLLHGSSGPGETQPACGRVSDEKASVCRSSPMGFAETFRLAALFATCWFAANYTYNISLRWTSVSSNTILSSTSGFWTLLMGSCFPGAEVDRFSWLRLFAVVSSVGGVVLVAYSDAEAGDSPGAKGNTVKGDLLALGSAILYGAYLTLLRYRTGGREIDMPLFLALVGVCSLVLLWPGFFIVHYSGLEPFAWPDRETWGYLMVNSLLGTVLSELLWLWATLLTSPLISTLALSLTIPLSMLADKVFGTDQARLTWMYILGTVLVLTAFVLVNVVTYHAQAVAGVLLCRRKRVTRRSPRQQAASAEPEQGQWEAASALEDA